MPELRFHKSSHSDAVGECVEVATNIPGTVAVRDSKDLGGPALTLTPTAWTAFHRAITDGQFERSRPRHCLVIPFASGQVGPSSGSLQQMQSR
ncbi:DUF397 domain-containing protein [Streptomyces kasugaensis]|uniref:DUF397 domain-containing protein n=1 Tax=Streptomyces kasugaensis TaxID=1946 RepID=A0A4Q9HPG8_STRKA|nr:DUF397 domain-containing protein [Streptomyces kasugaensis]